MASIRRRGRAKRNVWVVDYRDGPGVRQRITAANREAAEDLLADKIREGRQASPAAADGEIALAAYAERWLGQVSVRGAVGSMRMVLDCSVACSSSTTVRPRSPGQVFAHGAKPRALAPHLTRGPAVG